MYPFVTKAAKQQQSRKPERAAGLYLFRKSTKQAGSQKAAEAEGGANV